MPLDGQFRFDMKSFDVVYKIAVAGVYGATRTIERIMKAKVGPQITIAARL